MNTYCLVKNNRVPNMAPGWYLQIDTLEALDRHNTQHMPGYWNTYWKDPHTEEALAKGDLQAVVRHPMNILPKRAQALLRAFFQFGAVYINRMGGWMVLTGDNEILETLEDKSFPSSDELKKEFLYVTIAKWPMGNHYYLTSWPKPISFSQAKFNTLEAARAEAERHVDPKRVRVSESMDEAFMYPVEGD